MGESAGSVHFCQIDDLAQRFVMCRRVAAAASAEGDRQRTGKRNIFVGDMQRRREILQSLKSHVQRRLTVKLIQPVAELSAAKAKSIEIMLPDDILTITIIGACSNNMLQLRRDKAPFSGFCLSLRVFLRPADCFFAGSDICLQDRMALCNIVGISLPIIPA